MQTTSPSDPDELHDMIAALGEEMGVPHGVNPDLVDFDGRAGACPRRRALSRGSAVAPPDHCRAEEAAGMDC